MFNALLVVKCDVVADLTEYLDNWVIFFVITGYQWKFLPSKFTRPPKEFRIYGNEMRQTVLDTFVVTIEKANK